MDVEFRKNNFDLIRLLAATQVLVFHAFFRLGIEAPSWTFVFKIFHGVPVFFVLSGFLISASFERSSDLWKYSRNRIYRIIPGLWVCFFVTIFVFLYFGYRPVSALDYLWFPTQLLALIFTPSFLGSFGFGTYNGSLWTIPVELQFYIAVPFLYIFFNRSFFKKYAPLLAFSIFFAVSVIIRSAFQQFDLRTEPIFEKIIRYTFVPHIYLFLFGVLMQKVKIYNYKFIYNKGIYWALFYILVSLGVESIDANMYFLVPLLQILLGITAISVAYTGVGLSDYLLRKNDISYGVYLYHGLILNIVMELGLPSNYNTVLLVFFSSYVIGFFSWILVERPFIRRKHAVLRKT